MDCAFEKRCLHNFYGAQASIGERSQKKCFRCVLVSRLSSWRQMFFGNAGKTICLSVVLNVFERSRVGNTRTGCIFENRRSATSMDRWSFSISECFFDMNVVSPTPFCLQAKAPININLNKFVKLQGLWNANREKHGAQAKPSLRVLSGCDQVDGLPPAESFTKHQTICVSIAILASTKNIENTFSVTSRISKDVLHEMTCRVGASRVKTIWGIARYGNCLIPTVYLRSAQLWLKTASGIKKRCTLQVISFESCLVPTV